MRWTPLLAALLIAGCDTGTGTDTGTDTDTDAAVDDTDVDSPAVDVDPSDRCAFIQASVTNAGFGSDVTVECSSTHATFTSDTFPDHTLMTGITGTNLQVPVPAIDHAVPIPLSPSLAAEVTSIDNAIAIAVNGVPIYDYSSQGTITPGEYDPTVDTLVNGELDVCGGHSGRGDDYHYHVAPNCMIEAMDYAGDDAVLGWGFDGYPIYGNNNPDGSAISDGDLGGCNGQADDDFGWRYHTSDDPPYIVQCLVGEVDTSLYAPISPMDMEGGNGSRDLGALPSGGDPVENLVLTQSADGSVEMVFSQEGSDFSIAYSPGTNAGCYDFVTTGLGASPSSGTYCR